MTGQSSRVSDAAFEIGRMFRLYAEAGKTFQPGELAAFASFMRLMGDVSRSMENNLRAYRTGALIADAAAAMSMTDAIEEPGSNVVLFPVVRRENFGGEA